LLTTCATCVMDRPSAASACLMAAESAAARTSPTAVRPLSTYTVTSGAVSLNDTSSLAMLDGMFASMADLKAVRSTCESDRRCADNETVGESTNATVWLHTTPGGIDGADGDSGGDGDRGQQLSSRSALNEEHNGAL